ncbi:unnamed protein product [Amoebophrya sp. A120]|nr:unnamed protein product [Amoebophrya sp. A120]|eukprot:GSA120T00018028001.1
MSLLPSECAEKCRELRESLKQSAESVRQCEQDVLAVEDRVWQEHLSLFEKCFPGRVLQGTNWSPGSVRNASRAAVEKLVLEPVWRDMRHRVNYQPYGAWINQADPRDLERKTLLELLALQLRQVDAVYEAAREAEIKLGRRIARQEKEERTQGRVTLTAADSGPVQRLKAERPQIWAACVTEANTLHQYLQRLRAFQEQMLRESDFARQRAEAVPAVVARAVCDYFFYECQLDLEKIKLWWAAFQQFLQENKAILKSLRLDEADLPTGDPAAVETDHAQAHTLPEPEAHISTSPSRNARSTARIVIKNFKVTLAQLDMRRHGFVKHMDFGQNEVQTVTKGFQQRPWSLTTTLPVVAAVLTDLRKALRRCETASIPALESAGRVLLEEEERQTDTTAFEACASNAEAAEHFLHTVRRALEGKQKNKTGTSGRGKAVKNTTSATSSSRGPPTQPMWANPDPSAPYILPKEDGSHLQAYAELAAESASLRKKEAAGNTRPLSTTPIHPEGNKKTTASRPPAVALSNKSAEDVILGLISTVDRIQALFLDFLATGSTTPAVARHLCREKWDVVIGWLSNRSEDLLNLLDAPRSAALAEHWCHAWLQETPLYLVAEAASDKPGRRTDSTSCSDDARANAQKREARVTATAMEMLENVGTMTRQLDMQAEDVARFAELKGFVLFATDCTARYAFCEELLHVHAASSLAAKFVVKKPSATANPTEEDQHAGLLFTAGNTRPTPSSSTDSVALPRGGGARAAPPQAPANGVHHKIKLCPTLGEQRVPPHPFAGLLARNCPGRAQSEAPESILQQSRSKTEEGMPPGTIAGRPEKRSSKTTGSSKDRPTTPPLPSTALGNDAGAAKAIKPDFLIPKRPLEDPPARGRPTLPPILMEELRRVEDN